MENKYLLGATTENELVFGEIEITNRNGYTEFTASFSTVRPFNGDEYNLEEYYRDYWIDSMDKSYLYDLCEQFDCAPSELAENLANECDDVRDALDCSLYSEEVIVNGESWFFESSACGQHDTRKDGMKKYVNEEAYHLLHELWDNHHLKEIDEEIIKQVKMVENMLSYTDEEEWIINYIEEEYYN